MNSPISTSNTPTFQLKEDPQALMLLHLSQLLFLFTGIGGLVVPIILWQTQKDKVDYMDEQGKEVLNFQISLFIYGIGTLILALISTLLLFVLIGFLLLPIVFITALGIVGLNLILPIIYAIKANNGEKQIRYPFSIRFIK